MLIDSNIFIEVAKSQNRSDECGDLLAVIDEGLIDEDIFITEFALNALLAILSRHHPDFLKTILLLIQQDKIMVKSASIEDHLMTLTVFKNLKLDFDDATQFLVANRLQTYIVTYDKDF